ncbi:MAG: outer membrane protein assembly factor BamD [Bacteroidota bacterium]
MKTLSTIILGTMIALHTHASAQTSIHISSTPLLAGVYEMDEPGENKKDPAYKTYKEGYDAVLDERWDNAIKKFAEVASKYPKSEYLDDAEYWTAYALSHTNRKKAIAAYEEFIHKYPRSSYEDDDLADLGDLEQTVTISASGDSNHIVVSSSGNE